MSKMKSINIGNHLFIVLFSWEVEKIIRITVLNEVYS